MSFEAAQRGDPGSRPAQPGPLWNPAPPEPCSRAPVRSAL